MYTINSLSIVIVKSLSRVRLFATPWTVAHQAPLSMGFSRQEYWSGLPFPSLGDLPDPGIEPRSPALQADSLTSEPPGKPRVKQILSYEVVILNLGTERLKCITLMAKQQKESSNTPVTNVLRAAVVS